MKVIVSFYEIAMLLWNCTYFSTKNQSMHETDEQTGVEPPQEQQAAKVVIKETLTSSEPIVAPDKLRQPNNVITCIDNDATIVLQNGSNAVHFYDQQGEPISLPNTSLMITDWEQIDPPSSGNWQLSKEPVPGATNVTTLEGLPESLRPAAASLLQGQDQVELPTESWKITSADLSKIVVDTDEDSVMIYEPGTQSFIAFLKKDSGGNALPPRNWQRIDTQQGNKDMLPESVKTRIELLSQPNLKSVIPLHNGLSVVVSAGGFIVRNPDGTTEHNENVPNIKNNIAEDPNKPGIFYFCAESGRSIQMLDTTKGTMNAETLALPKEYSDIKNLRLDNSGNFVTFASRDTFVMLQRSIDGKALEVIGTIPDIRHADLDTSITSSGNKNLAQVRGFTNEGRLVSYEANFEPIIQQIQQRDAAEALKAAQGSVKTADEREADARQAREEVYGATYGQGRADAVTDIAGRLANATTFDQVTQERDRVTNLLASLDTNLPIPDPTERQEVIAYYRAALEQVVNDKEQAIGTGFVTNNFDRLTTLIGTPLSYDTNQAVDPLFTQLHGPLQRFLNDEQRKALTQLEGQYTERSSEYRGRQAQEIEARNASALEHLSQALGLIRNSNTFNDFLAGQESIVLDDGTRVGYDSLRAQMTSIKVFDENAPLLIKGREAIQAAIREKREQLEDLEAVKGDTPAEMRKARIKLQRDEIRDFVQILAQKFTTRQEVLAAVDSSSPSFLEGYQTIKDSIALMDKDAQEKLERFLGTQLYMTIFEIDRKQNVGGDMNGIPQVRFGNQLFPRWEEPHRPRRAREINLTFMPSGREYTYMADGRPKTVQLGEIGIEEKNGKPGVIRRRVYQGKTDNAGHDEEEKWQLGNAAFRGEFAPSTDINNVDFNAVLKDFADWEKGDRSKIRKEETEKRNAIDAEYQNRPVALPDGTQTTIGEIQARLAERRSLREAKDRGETIDEDRLTELNNLSRTDKGKYWSTDGVDSDDWEHRYQSTIDIYAQFVAEKRILLFERLEELRKSPEGKVAQGVGYVPDWNAGWTIDGQTEKYLEQIAEFAKAQLDKEQGVIALTGHAGTGKDVLIQMFCNLANRKLFTLDGSPFTTEKNLTETQVLVDGTVQTVPSVVLQAIQTPGTVMYFNEFNAMPASTQIVLNALFDGKRSVTLKTSPEKGQIKAAEDVLLFASMNPPQYEGVEKTSSAFLSRASVIPVDYPPLFTDAAKTNYNSADALRIARSVKSLESTTYDMDLNQNDFVKIWDRYLNGKANGAQPLNDEQRFDLTTIYVLAQYTDKLREQFMETFKGSLGSGSALSLPITSRELSDCARELSQMTDNEKRATNPLTEAQKLLKKHFTAKMFYDEKEKEDTELLIDSPPSAWGIRPTLPVSVPTP
jgi:MoxR-like ATPase